jgi:hypothetical protein
VSWKGWHLPPTAAGVEGESGLGEESVDEGGPVLDALEPVLDDRGQLVDACRYHPGRFSRVIGTGADGALPVMQQVRDEARRRKIDLVILPRAEAIGASRRQRHGMSSAAESGVCPYDPRNSRDALFLRLRIFPRSMIRS